MKSELELISLFIGGKKKKEKFPAAGVVVGTAR